MSIAELIVRGSRLSRRRRLLLARAAWALAGAAVAVRFLPFRRAIRFGSAPVGDRQVASVREHVWAVERTAQFLPVRSVCIHKGLALQRMLRSDGVGAVLHYGVGRNSDELRAHVWVTVDGEIVIGGDEAAHFHCVATYP